jgi:small subunit ribosomal protein S20
MPNTKSAKKDLSRSIKRQAYNKRIKDNLKNAIKQSKKALDTKDKKAKELVDIAFKALDKAAQKGVIKTNTRDRKKSRLHRKLNETLKS